MSALAWFFGFAALLSFYALTLLSLASRTELAKRHPGFARALYRTHRELLWHRGCPIKTRVLILQAPDEPDDAIRLMRLCAFVGYLLLLAAIAMWALEG